MGLIMCQPVAKMGGKGLWKARSTGLPTQQALRENVLLLFCLSAVVLPRHGHECDESDYRLRYGPGWGLA